MASEPAKGTSNTKLAMAVIGLIGTLGGSGGTYAVMKYRLDAGEKERATLRADMRALDAKLDALGAKATCMICKAHDMDCPGC